MNEKYRINQRLSIVSVIGLIIIGLAGIAVAGAKSSKVEKNLNSQILIQNNYTNISSNEIKKTESSDKKVNSSGNPISNDPDSTLKDIDKQELSVPVGLNTFWLNCEYVETLKTTRSPMKAAQDIYYVSINFKKSDTNIEWEQIYNFHEGLKLPLDGFKKMVDDSYMPVLNKSEVDYYSVKDDRLVFTGNPIDKIEWNFKDKNTNPGELKNLKFVRAEPNVETFINRYAIAGKYKDEQGHIYTFSEEGKAVWPDKTFDYETGLDFILTKFDYFFNESEYEINKPVIVGFEWINNKLHLFKGFDNEQTGGFLKENKPYLILTPIE